MQLMPTTFLLFLCLHHFGRILQSYHRSKQVELDADLTLKKPSIKRQIHGKNVQSYKELVNNDILPLPEAGESNDVEVGAVA